MECFEVIVNNQRKFVVFAPTAMGAIQKVMAEYEHPDGIFRLTVDRVGGTVLA